MIMDTFLQVYGEQSAMKEEKDSTRHCLLCKQHGLIVKTKGHNCDRKDCNCDKCEMIRNRRQIMSMQIKLRRKQDKIYKSGSIDLGSETSSRVPYGVGYTCQRCKNHGKVKMRKDHSRECEFSSCECEMCILVRQNTKIEGEKKRRTQRTINASNTHSATVTMETRRSAFSPLYHCSDASSSHHNPTSPISESPSLNSSLTSSPLPFTPPLSSASLPFPHLSLSAFSQLNHSLNTPFSPSLSTIPPLLSPESLLSLSSSLVDSSLSKPLLVFDSESNFLMPINECISALLQKQFLNMV